MKDLGLLLVRVCAGAFLIYGHGFSKLQTVFSGAEIKFSNPIGIGSGLSLYLSTFAEFFCSVLLILGLFPRLSLIVLIINMSVAAFFQHSSDPFSVKEKALLYLILFILLFITGVGKYSLNYLLPSKFRKY